MTYRERLILFMEKKARKIKKETGIDYYFKEEDKKAILSWNEEKAKQAWNFIKKEVYEKKEAGLTARLCPFCVVHWGYLDSKRKASPCDKCEYAKVHSACFYENSDYRKIFIATKEGRLFTNHWYKIIIAQIEKKDFEQK